MKDKLEISAVGAVAPSGHSPLGTYSREDPKTKKTRKKRRLSNKGKAGKNQPHEFKQMENKKIKKKVNIRETIRDMVFDMVLSENSNPQSISEWAAKVYSSLSTKMGLHLTYSKLFISDAMKFEDPEIFKMNMNRVKLEVKKMNELVQDINSLVAKLEEHKLRSIEQEDKPRPEQQEESKKPLKEGLEKYVDDVIQTNAPDLYDSYHWDNGMKIDNRRDVQKLIDTLNDSGEFGKATFNKSKGRIEFGVHPSKRGR